MKKSITEIVFILDKSGSMSGLETDTIGGFNSMLNKQKKPKEKLLSLLYYLIMVMSYCTITSM